MLPAAKLFCRSKFRGAENEHAINRHAGSSDLIDCWSMAMDGGWSQVMSHGHKIDK